jgi:1-acyl-sn-glycerol-3-phosphate acyltransferase
MDTKLDAPHQEPYVPDLGMVYPSVPDEHMYPGRDEPDVVVDEHYPFLDRSLKFRIQSALVYLGIFTIVFFLCPIRYGLKIEGLEILKKHRRLFKNGALTVSNHMLKWDILCILMAIRYRRLYFPAWTGNLHGSGGKFIRWAGGIPVPKNLHAIRYFNQAFDELHRKKKWFHVFPESCRWTYYQPIRPFKKGMFSLAYRYNLPVIPFGFSYRRPAGIYALFKKGHPLITLRIGEPILPDLNLPRKEAVQRLREACHKKIVELAGVRNNPWPCEGD